MTLYRCKVFGCEMSIYLEDHESKISDVQLKILAHYISSGAIPFNERYILQTLHFLYDNNLIDKERLDEIIPFKSIVRAKSRLTGRNNDEQTQ